MAEELTDLEKYLIQKIKSSYDYWQGYANIFEQKEREIEEKKKEVFKIFKESPDTDEAKRLLTFIQYDYQNHLADLKNIVTKLLALYNLADTLKLTDQFTESLNNKMQKVKSTEKGETFIFDDNKLVERIEGERDKFLKSMQENPFYKDAMEMVSKKFDD